jgi:uncharacterized protein (TIGR02246 family)
MRMRWFCFTALAALVLVVSAGIAPAEGPKDKAVEEAAILKNAEAFVAAFHKGDAKAVAAFWTKDGDYTDQSGHTFKGRDAIEKLFTEFFAENKGVKLRIEVLGMKFVTGDVALEDGMTATLSPDGAPPSRARYTIVHVKQDGKWMLSSVRDAPFAVPTNQEHFRGLEWVIGDWAADSDRGETARVAFAYTDSQNFITSSFTTTFKNLMIGGGTQWIGYDPLAKGLRSWTFENGGGFGEGTWTQDGDKWTVKSTGVTRDGKKLAATNILTRIDTDTMSWESKNRTEDGKELPDVKPIKMKRVK